MTVCLRSSTYRYDSLVRLEKIFSESWDILFLARTLEINYKKLLSDETLLIKHVLKQLVVFWNHQIVAKMICLLLFFAKFVLFRQLTINFSDTYPLFYRTIAPVCTIWTKKKKNYRGIHQILNIYQVLLNFYKAID